MATRISPVRISVVGAGMIGRRHVEAIAGAGGTARLHSIVDPQPGARDFAATLGVPWHSDVESMIASDRPDGVILATPNQLHAEQGLRCLAAGIPVLVEKPIATDVASARRLVDEARSTGTPLLVGHHRRHSPLVAAAKAAIESGVLGTIVAVHGMFWTMKPDDYFEVGWRRRKGAGPVFLNLIHDVDLLRHFCGEIASVQALESNAVRGNEVEETTVVVLRFESGALGTVNVSDTVVAPWSWELTAGENRDYHQTPEACYMIGGTHGSLAVPNLALWRNPGARSWKEPVEAEALASEAGDPLERQIRQFARVIRDGEAPLVPGEEGLQTLRVIEAIKKSAATGETVTLDDRAGQDGPP